MTSANSQRTTSSNLPNSLVDEEFLKHYKVDEIQGNGGGMNPLVDEEFLRHYQVEEIMAAAGQYNPAAAAAAAAYGSGYYGYEYYMQGGQNFGKSQ